MSVLSKIQTELHAPKGQRNSFGNYNYRSCEDILEALKPFLRREGVCVTITDEVKECAGIPYIESTVSLVDKEKIVAQVKAQAGINPNRKGMDVAQCFGASSSYARKYALAGMFLLDDNKDPDATNTHETTKPEPKAEPKPVTKQQPKAEKPVIDEEF